MSIINLTPSQLRQAANIKEKIEQLQKQLGQLQGTKVVPASAPATKPAKKKISAAGIARIKAAQKARWAKIKGGAKPTAKTANKPTAKPAKKARKKMSAEGRAKIVAAAKARWAKSGLKKPRRSNLTTI